MRFLLLASLLLSLPAFASDLVVSTYKLQRPDPATVRAVVKYFAVETHGHAHDGSVEVFVPADEAGFFQLLAPNAVLIDADIAATAQARLRSFASLSFNNRPGYRSLPEVQTWMQDVERNHPAIAKVEQYGESAAGRPLLALKVGKGDSTKPALLVTAATHGDELITTEVLTRLIDKLLTGYGNDARLTQMVDRHDIYFVPVLNVDGFAATSRFDGRADPNRSYPWPGNTGNRPTASIAGIIKLFERIKPVGSIDFHAYGEMVMYPWAYTHDPIDQTSKDKLHALTKSMAEKNGYEYGPIADVIYLAPGSSADYYFWTSRTMGIAIEIGNSKIPHPDQIPRFVQSQEESLWRFLEAF